MQVVWVSPGVLTDAGGFIITIGSDGKVHIKRVPGWDPQVRAEVGAAIKTLDAVAAIKDSKVAARFIEAAEATINAHVGTIQKHVGG